MIWARMWTALTTDPGFVNLAGTTNASDFDLVKGSQLIDKGVNLAEITADFLDRPAPVATLDVGAFEYQANSTSGGSSGTGGTSARPTGGAPATGGTSAKSTGGAPSVGGSGTQATGGAPTIGTGGSSSTGSCSCKVPVKPNRSGAAAWIGLLMLGWGLQRRNSRAR